jgi:hypothetical protein
LTARRLAKLAVSLGLAVWASSCKPPEQDYMPLGAGHAWTYQVQGNFDEYVDDLRTVAPTVVGPVRGWELAGKMGTCKLAWSGATLLASELAGRTFEPPIPVFSSLPRSWAGHTTVGGKRITATATLAGQKGVEKFADRNAQAWKSTLTLDCGGQATQVVSWFVAGVGIVRQEQRTGGHRDLSLEYLSGPVVK